MAEAYVIDAVRTPVGKRGGGLAGVHSADLGAHVLKALMDRTGVDPGAVEDVIFGCCDTVGSQAGDIARTAWLAAGLPQHVPGVTIDRQCGSSQQSVHFAAQAVLSGTSDLVVAGGVQNMSQIPISYAMTCAEPLGFSDPFRGSKGWVARYGAGELSQFRSAEMIAEKWDVSREDMERFAYESHQRAIRATDAGRFANEIVPIAGVERDEGPRRDTSLEKMAKLQPLSPDGRLTAAMASQISDGASALLVASEAAVKTHGLRPRARVHHISVRADDPIYMLTAPIPATRRALAKTGLKMADIAAVEINEAFASVVIAWQKELDPDMATVNPNGGAIALGHPIGATGTRLMATLLNELERTGGRYGLQTMCEGGGQANVTILERLVICEDRVVIVTGAGRGLGRAHALAFAAAGAKVVVNDLGVENDGRGGSTGPAHDVVAEIRAAGGEAVANGSDIADWKQAGALVQSAIDAFGRLDVVVNNAGFVRDRMFVSTSEEEWDAVLRVHLKGHFCVTRQACDHWRAESKAGRPVDARIINTSSGAGLQGSVGQSAYSAAKAGIAALTLVQAAELGRYGITSNAIAPSARTRMTEGVFADMMKKPDAGFDAMDPANVSPLVVWLGSAESKSVTGCVFEIAGGKLSLADGWRAGPVIDKGARFEPDEIGGAVHELLKKAVPAQKVYGT